MSELEKLSTWHRMIGVESEIAAYHAIDYQPFKGLLAWANLIGMLFSSVDCPDIKPVNQSQDIDKLRGDWGGIGGDFYSFIQRKETGEHAQ